MTVGGREIGQARADELAEVSAGRVGAGGPVAGTVGGDVITVHELVWAGEAQRAKCGDGGSDDEVVEWLRSVNCVDCRGE